MPMDPAVATAIAGVARAVKTGDPDIELSARQRLTAAKLERHIRDALAAPLSDRDRNRLAVMLARGGAE